jgi:hypothetical protein
MRWCVRPRSQLLPTCLAAVRRRTDVITRSIVTPIRCAQHPHPCVPWRSRLITWSSPTDSRGTQKESLRGRRARERALVLNVEILDNDARLAFRVGQIKGEQFVDDATFDAVAKHQHIGFDPAGPGGALQFEASERDWIKEFTTTGPRGPKRPQASLIDPCTHDVFDIWEKDLILDDVPPPKRHRRDPGQGRQGNRSSVLQGDRCSGDVTVPSGKTVRQDLYLKLP